MSTVELAVRKVKKLDTSAISQMENGGLLTWHDAQFGLGSRTGN